MVKKKNRLMILICLLLGVSLVTVIVKNYKVEKEKISNIAKTIIDEDAESITSIDWTYSSSSLSFVKTDDIWYLEADDKFPVDQETIQEIIEDIAKVDASFIIEDVSDYNQYGLDSPKATVSFKIGEDEYIIKFGNYSSMDEERYVDIDDGNVYLLSEDIMDVFDKDVDDFFKYEEVPDVRDFSEMLISGEVDLDVVYVEDNDYTYSTLFTYFLKKGSKYLTLGNDEVETLAKDITNISFNDYLTYSASDEDLSVYGMDEPRITVKFNYKDEDENDQTFTIYLSSDVIPEDEDDDFNCYARIDGSENIYSISKGTFNEFVNASYDSLRPSEVILLDFKEVTQIDIELDDEEYVIYASVDKDENITYTFNDEEAEFDNVISALEDLEINEYSEDIPGKTKQLKLTIHLNSEKYPSLTLEFYKYNSEYSMLVFDNSYKALLSREEVVDLIETINKVVLD